MVALTVIVFVQVISRYVFKTSVGDIGELPVYLMILAIWVAGALLARKDDHIKLDVMQLIIKNKKILKSIRLFVNVLTVGSIGFFTYLSFDYVQFGIATGDTSAGLGFPLWWLTSFIMISGLLITIYYMLHSFKEAKELKKWKS
jgi:TRAP-type C4-dicarboxylate transport system permease small subunit